VNQRTDGLLPLVEAVDAGPELVEALIRAGADVNAPDASGMTPLVKSAARGRAGIVKLLLNAGADPNRKASSVACPLSSAVERRSADNLKALEALLAAGADVNATLTALDGTLTGTPLTHAANLGNVEAVCALVAAGAQVDTVTLFGTALTRAAEEGHEEIVKILLGAGADRDLRVPDLPNRLGKSAGKSALELARQKKRRRIVALLEGPHAGTPEPAPEVAAAWQRLEAILGVQRPKVLRTLRPGTKANDLAQLVAALGQPLPHEVQRFFQCHDGQRDSRDAPFIRTGDEFDEPFRLLPIADSLRERLQWLDLLAAGALRGTALPAAGVAQAWFHPGWLPLTADGLGNHHCLDLAPAATGRMGQVILVWHDQAARLLVADSIAEWLTQIAESLEVDQA
jgi:cell wall assembly regulator SMI1